jgi:hypothetical protein
MCSAPETESRHCPSFGPTRLAVGLELEVFYTKHPKSRVLRDSPRFAICEVLVPPRCSRVLDTAATSADNIVNGQDITPAWFANQP